MQLIWEVTDNTVYLENINLNVFLLNILDILFSALKKLLFYYQNICHLAILILNIEQVYVTNSTILFD